MSLKEHGVREIWAMKRTILIVAGGLFALAGIPFLAWNGLVEQGNVSSYDMLLRLSSVRHSSALTSTVLLAIDDETVNRYGALPLDRAVVAEGLTRVASAGPKVLGVDMLWSERTWPEADLKLADALGQFPSVVLASALEASQGGQQSRWISPLPEFQAHAFALGHVHFEPDRDGVARTLLLAKATDDHRYWALGLELYRAASGAARPPIEKANELLVANRRIPAADSTGRLLWINFIGPEGTFRRVSLADVLDNRIPASVFAGKVVILGVTAQGAGDRVYTPFSTGLGMSGIEVHANIFATLSDGAYLHLPGALPQFLSFAAIAAIVAAAAWWRNGRLLAHIAIAGVIAFPVAAYLLLGAGVIVPVASALAVHVAASITGFIAHSRFIQHRLGEAVAGRQDYAFRLQAVAHEIKTPLTAIHASSQLITDQDISERKKEEIAQRIHKEAGRLSGVVNTFLDVERISAGALKLVKHQVELSALVREASERAGLLGLKKEMVIEQNLDAVSVPADADLLQFAVYNLIANAIKYSPEGSSVRISLRSDAKAACLVVADQGCGIEPAEQNRIFEPFYRARKHRGSSEPGTGVGLALVKEIVTQHGGRIEVESEPGRGSRFSVFLPREEGV